MQFGANADIYMVKNQDIM